MVEPGHATKIQTQSRRRQAAFSVVFFQTSINTDRKHLVTSHPVWQKIWMTVKFGDSKLHNDLPAGPSLRTFVLYSIIICSRPEATSDVISGVVVEGVDMDVQCQIWWF